MVENKKLKASLLTLAWTAGTLAATQAGAALGPAQTAFAERMAKTHGLDKARVTETLAAARHDPKIIARISSPAEALPWHRYRTIFITETRISGGVDYWRAHRDLLDAAEREYGVPPHIIVAIIGVETNYGANTGSHRVIDALTTLGFGYPKRADFFLGELEHFLLLTTEEGVDPLSLRGSYAGAMGRAQFIPSSYRRYAVDFDGDGKRDLWHSDADAIGSVASYLARHGWRTGAPITDRLPSIGSPPERFLAAKNGSEPSFSLADLAGSEIDLPQDADPTRQAVVVELEAERGKEYWLGYYNFYAITRYNHSNLYAMAVNQLAEAILKRVNETRETRG